MKNIALLMICFLCFCSHHKIIRPKKENAEAINLSDSCKSKIEQILFKEFNKRYSYFSSMKTHNNDTIIVYLPVCIFGLLFTSFSAKQFSYINIPVLIILITVGITAFLAQLFMTYGFKFISSTRGSIVTFSKIPMTIGLSFFIGEEFKLKFIIGTILIIIGLIINRK